MRPNECAPAAGKWRGRPVAQDVDRLVAARIRERRAGLGLTTREVADRLGLTLEQVRKIEAGLLMVAPRRLHAIAGLLGVGVAELFAPDGTGNAGGAGREGPALDRLLADFAALGDRERKALLRLSRALAGRAEADGLGPQRSSGRETGACTPASAPTDAHGT